MIKDLFAEKYKFTAVFPDDSPICFDTADHNDIPKLADMYNGVKITRGNYKLRFDPGSDRNFGNVGGMFNALSEKDIEYVLNDCNSSVLTARHGGDIVGMFWVSKNDPAFANREPPGKVMYFRDIIVAGTNVPSIPLLFIYTAIKLAKQAGYTHSLAEIYKITAYNDGVRREVGLFNSRSYGAALSAGGRFAGELPPKTVSADGIEVEVKSKAVEFEYDEVLHMLKRKITELGIKRLSL